MNQPTEAETLMKQGKRAIDEGDWTTLREVNQKLISLLPSHAQADMRTKIGFS
jgi:hypothetical protein